MEASLQAHYGIDYRDRWRRDEHGRRRLTLRRIGVLVRHLPPDSAVALATGGAGWTVTDYLISDVFHAHAGKAHPARPKPSKIHIVSPEREKRLRAARRRRADRQAAIARGEIK